MICPVCHQHTDSNQLFGWYKGNIFIVKKFRCCYQDFHIGFEDTRKDLVYNKDTDDYELKEIRVFNPIVKFDYTRLLAGSNEVHRGWGR